MEGRCPVCQYAGEFKEEDEEVYPCPTCHAVLYKNEVLPKKRSKFNARRVEIDGYWFDSDMEGKRYAQLKLMEATGEIANLELHPKFPIVVNGEKVCVYEADFRYWDREKDRYVVEDVKGVRTAVYRLKKKLMEVVNGIKIVETK